MASAQKDWLSYLPRQQERATDQDTWPQYSVVNDSLWSTVSELT